MEIGAIANSTSKSTKPAGTLSADFETFLKMLTTQMQHQDPLNPIESSDYAVQLATFSNVEQSVLTNQLLEGMQQQFGLMSMSQLAGWVGQGARSSGPAYVSEAAAITLSPNPAATSDRAVLVVRNAAGEVIAREDLPVSAEDFDWLPRDATGAALPTGTYDLTLESYYQDSLLLAAPIEHYARIAEAQGGPSGTRLVLEGGIEVAATDVTALRIPH